MLDPRTQKSEHLMQICQVERESARKRSAHHRLEVEWGDDDVPGEIQKPHHKCTREKPKGITVNKGDTASHQQRNKATLKYRAYLPASSSTDEPGERVNL